MITYFIGYVLSEMCLLNPYQRGGLVPDAQLNEDGAPACDVRNTYENATNPGKAPCYGRSKSDERITQFIGRNALQVMIAQKNKDWFNPQNPGNFTFNLWAYLGDDNYKKVHEFGSIPDTNLTKEFYQINATIPNDLTQEHYVVQTIYYTNTKDVNGTVVQFIQCADVLAL